MVDPAPDGSAARAAAEQRLHFATRPGWLAVLRLPYDFTAADIEPLIGVGRGPALKQLERAAELDLVERKSEERAGRGGAFQWRVTDEGAAIAEEAAAFVDALAGVAEAPAASTVAIVAIAGAGLAPLGSQPEPDDLVDALHRLVGGDAAGRRSEVFRVTRS